MSYRLAYQSYAAQCIKIAEAIKNREQKAVLRNMAQAWLILAEWDETAPQQAQTAKAEALSAMSE